MPPAGCCAMTAMEEQRNARRKRPNSVTNTGWTGKDVFPRVEVYCKDKSPGSLGEFKKIRLTAECRAHYFACRHRYHLLFVFCHFETSNMVKFGFVILPEKTT